ITVNRLQNLLRAQQIISLNKRKLKKLTPNIIFCALLHGHLSFIIYNNESKIALAVVLFLLLYGKFPHFTFSVSCTTFTKHTRLTIWAFGHTLYSAKFHNGLVVVCSKIDVQHFVGQFFELLFASRGIYRGSYRKIPGEHPKNIAIQHSPGLASHKRADGRSCV